MLNIARLYYFVFAALTAAGGVMGFVKASSKPSLIAGVGAASGTVPARVLKKGCVYARSADDRPEHCGDRPCDCGTRSRLTLGRLPLGRLPVPTTHGIPPRQVYPAQARSSSAPQTCEARDAHPVSFAVNLVGV